MYNPKHRGRGNRMHGPSHLVQLPAASSFNRQRKSRNFLGYSDSQQTAHHTPGPETLFSYLSSFPRKIVILSIPRFANTAAFHFDNAFLLLPNFASSRYFAVVFFMFAMVEL